MTRDSVLFERVTGRPDCDKVNLTEPFPLLQGLDCRKAVEMTSDEDVRQIVRAQSGDLRAFEELMRRLQPELGRFLRRVMGAHPGSDDVLQETFVRIWRGLKWLRDPALLRPWAYRIALREAQRALRREHHRDDSRADSSELDQLTIRFADPEIRIDAQRALAKVSPLARLVLVAHFFEGFTLDEIGASTATPLGTVKSRLASGLSQLRRLMETTG